LIEYETGYEEGRPSEKAALPKRPRAGLQLRRPPFSEGQAFFQVNSCFIRALKGLIHADMILWKHILGHFEASDKQNKEYQCISSSYAEHGTPNTEHKLLLSRYRANQLKLLKMESRTKKPWAGSSSRLTKVK
jgi:hypothetical protein